MKEQILRAIRNNCAGSLAIRSVPAGLAVSTGFRCSNGDLLAFFLIGPDERGLFRIEDDGMTVALAESDGFTLSNKRHRSAFNHLASLHGISLDAETEILRSQAVSIEHIGPASMAFVSFMLGMQGLVAMGEATDCGERLPAKPVYAFA